mmetsp:Transcript_1249/g.2266  ORF Transcript_1249/g.2266 Transcript_1249/m.2266 type:complete len:627 (+) Transcript_1249:140-2020(+)|eukprot:CAMPEP_0176487512 /NCGR_PEP_ID=MMETSP0200_2-20121128/6179_1 /TAXON_ID=947934 /ORGANISM="Chaetoceros sp., Strain GSL56" /LENGTH=626 /DNA_ID=CAMNT_0017884361 /DNA_START=95 /DNA_END=1975 /DNA_ORIENTATION=-
MTTQTLNIIPLAKIDWPQSLPKGRIQCGSTSYLAYRARKEKKIPFLHFSSFAERTGSEISSSESNAASYSKKQSDAKKTIDLNTLSAEQLEELSYYDVLGGIKMHSTPEQIKRAFHKACLKYHPDKDNTSKESKNNSGEDPVFLKVKEAFETLSDPQKRKAYDSTVDFDDSIPSPADVKDDSDFYRMFGQCFERNLRFAAENDPDQNQAAAARKKRAKRGKAKDKKKSSDPPSLGDDNTEIGDVHEFYDYWIHFESWRDFTLAASKITDHDTDMAGDRYEKRWMEKEIARKAKALKKEEIARITKLVERSMSLDPRLKREKERVEREKTEKARLREERLKREEQERKEKEEKEARERAELEAREREKQAQSKLKKEQEKKIIRKSRQALRKLVLGLYENECKTDNPTWCSFHDMNDDVEMLCEKLSAVELDSITSEILDASHLIIVSNKANDLRDDTAKAMKAEERQRELLRLQAKKKEEAAKVARASKPWSREEITALTKAIKKYPAGGANRWETIALFVNNLCKLQEPRKKEECIEKYNQLLTSSATPSDTQSQPAQNKTSTCEWNEEQDKQLQAGLAKYPASMDKNERWSNIASEVTGKSKKDCVARFKAIREALKKSKSNVD